jgi:hypothetical protein
MNAFARRLVGAGIFGLSVLIGLFLHSSGVSLLTLSKLDRETFPHGEVVTAAFRMRSPLIGLLVAAILGLCLLLMPSKSKIPPKINPDSSG